MGIRKGRFVAALSAATLAGCSTTHHFQIAEPVREGVMTPARVDSFGGAVAKAEVIPCPGGMSDVFVKQSFLRSLLSTLTLGAYQETRIEYVCAKPSSDDTPVLGGTPSHPEGAPGHGG